MVYEALTWEKNRREELEVAMGVVPGGKQRGELQKFCCGWFWRFVLVEQSVVLQFQGENNVGVTQILVRLVLSFRAVDRSVVLAFLWQQIYLIGIGQCQTQHGGSKRM